MISLLLLGFLSCDAVSLSKSFSEVPTVITVGGTSGDGAKYEGDTTNHVPGAANGKRWVSTESKVKQDVSHDFQLDNSVKRNVFKGDGNSENLFQTANFAQQGKAVLNAQSKRQDDKRLWAKQSTYHKDVGIGNFEASRKNLGAWDKHTHRNYLTGNGDKYVKDGVTGETESMMDFNGNTNVSAWALKKGRHSSNSFKDHMVASGKFAKSFGRGTLTGDGPKNEDDDVLWQKPEGTSDSAVTTKEGNWGDDHFPDVQAKELMRSGHAAVNGAWRPTKTDAAGVNRADIAGGAGLTYPEWVRATYAKATICPAGHWAGTDGCVLHCGYRDDDAGTGPADSTSPCKDKTDDEIVAGSDAAGEVTKCSAVNKVAGTGGGVKTCGWCKCKDK